MATITSHLSWGDKNVSMFFIKEITHYINLKKVTILSASGNVVTFTPELGVAYEMLRGLLRL